MPTFLAVRFVRILPMLIVLGIVAVIVFLIVQFKYSKPKAKEVLIVIFTWLNSINAVVFALASLYALFEGNDAAFDLMICFFITYVIGLLITLICRAVFRKHHPHYQFHSTRAFVKTRWHNLWDKAKKSAQEQREQPIK